MKTDEIYPTGPIAKLLKQRANLRRFRKKNRRSFESLTDREEEILALVAEGLKNSDIAKKLDISQFTVQNHRAQVRDKLNINYQTDFVKFALAYELIEF